MKSTFFTIALLSLLLPGIVLAIADDGVNSIGVYFDDGVFEQPCSDYVAFTPMNMYFVMANCSQSTIGGFEFHWDFAPQAQGHFLVLTVLLPPNALNIGNLHNIIVGLGSPYPTEEATVLAIAQIMFTTPDLQLDILMGPTTPASIAGWPAFVDGEDFDILLPMTYSTLWPEGGQSVDPEQGMIVIGSIGCPGPVATDSEAWDSLKALYR